MLRAHFVFASLVALVLVGCEGCSTSGVGGDDGGGGALSDGGGSGLQDGGPGTDGGDGGAPVGRTLVIEPENAVLRASVGGDETLQLTAFLVDTAGNRTPAVDAFWATLTPEIGSVDGNGLFSPSRERAGIARVRARAQGVEGVGEVTVLLDNHVDLSGGATGPGDFQGPPSSSAGPNVLYPLDGVVIPANLAPMLFQWDKLRSRSRVLLEGEYGSLALYTTSDRVEAPSSAWRTFLVAHLGRSFTATVEETEGPGSEVFRTTLTIHLADADLTSTVYYWAVNLGKIVRIDADSLAPTPLDIGFENVPDGSVPGGVGEQQCRACHTLSASGQHLAFTYFGGNGPGGLVDVNALATPQIPNRNSRRWNFAAISPDGSLLISNYQRRMSLRSGITGDVIPGFEDITGFDVAHPAFSPTGDRVAYAGHIASNGGQATWEIDFNQSNIYMADFDPIGPSFGSPQLLATGDGEAVYYPSFSPDGSLVAYTKGPHSRSATPDGVTPLPGEIWLAAANVTPDPATGAPRVRLDRANPEQRSYLPTFNPKVEGGYLWIAFVSRRDYGHITRGLERPQIWVAAIDADADLATSLRDPSHPPFWLPGQDSSTDNLTSFFAPKPCSPSGGTCESDGACCDGLLCRPAEGDAWQCVPPEEACLLTGDACTSDAECCDGLLCGVTSENGTRACVPPGEVCSQRGQVCVLDADCCDASAICTDDGTGVTRCSEPSCSELGDSCATRPCCPGAGVCINDTCLQVGG